MDNGYEMGESANIRSLVGKARAAAIWSYLGPVQKAYGNISPKNSTAVTEIRIAAQDGQI